jgi:hypothetical protein
LTLSRTSTKESYLDLPNNIGRPKYFAETGVKEKGRIAIILFLVASLVFLLKVVLDFEKLTD